VSIEIYLVVTTKVIFNLVESLGNSIYEGSSPKKNIVQVVSSIVGETRYDLNPKPDEENRSIITIECATFGAALLFYE